MKVKSALLAIVAIGALVLSGCSTSDDSGELDFDFLNDDDEEDQPKL